MDCERTVRKTNLQAHSTSELFREGYVFVERPAGRISRSTPCPAKFSDCSVATFFHPHVSRSLLAFDRKRVEPAIPGLSPLETALLAITATHLCFLPWALGSMHRWSQFVSLIFSLAGFIVSIMPRTGPTDRGYSPSTRLRRFPVLWAGLLFLLYIAVQALNPSWQYVSDTDSWWLEPVAHIAWLPSGMQVPFAQSSPWSALIIFTSLWLLICSVWTGLTRRRSYRILFTVLVANAFLLSMLGVLQQLTDAKRIFWSYLPSNSAFVASFIYRNHAGPYLNLMVSLAVGLGCWYYERSQRRQEKSSPAAVLAFLAMFIAIMVVFSYSRASIGVLLAFSLFMLCTLAAQRFLGKPGPSRKRMDMLILIVVFSGFLGLCLVSLRVEKVWHRFTNIATDPTNSTSTRTIARNASRDMLQDHWLLGWGAGCFRYGFPLYAQKYPEIYYSGQGKQRFWEHAHDDLLEFPIEYGLLGLLPLAFMLCSAGWQLVRRRFWTSAISICLVLSCALVACHSWVDFVFQSPAVLLTWCVLLVAAVRWVELDQPGSQRLVARLSRSGHGPTNNENLTINYP